MTDNNEHVPHPVRVTDPCAGCFHGCAKPCTECDQPGCLDHDEDCSRWTPGPPPPGLADRVLDEIRAEEDAAANQRATLSSVVLVERAGSAVADLGNALDVARARAERYRAALEQIAATGPTSVVFTPEVARKALGGDS